MRSRGSGRWRRVLIAALIVLAVAGAIAGAVTWAVQEGGYAPARIAWKRWRAPDKFTYDEIHPRFRETDPRGLIHVHNAADAAQRRAALVAAVFGESGYPAARKPDRIDANITLPELGRVDSLAGIDRLVVELGHGIVKPSYLLRPSRSNGTLVVYQHGYAGTFIQVRAHLKSLLDAGYTVLAMNLLSYDPGSWPWNFNLPGTGWYSMGPHDLPSFFTEPLRFWFEPAVASLNHAIATGGFQHVYMLGFSMGGWTTQVLTAMTPQIERSYSVAGGYELYLRSGERNETPPPALYGPMVRAASYLDMYVLAADRPGRRQVQVFNRYDRCCYRNTKALLYQDAVRAAVAEIGGGSFEVVIDETHADHKISDHAMALILADMARR
jgi:pimeloyl-ACP methyl ester carboxylesterase